MVTSKFCKDDRHALPALHSPAGRSLGILAGILAGMPTRVPAASPTRLCAIPRTLIATAVVLCALAGPAAAQAGAERSAPQSGNSGSAVEQLTAMLQAIEPYRPLSEVVQTVKVFGSTSMDGLAHGWVKGFENFHAQAKVEVTAASYEVATKQLIANPSAIAMYARPVTDQELADMHKAGLKRPMAFEVAREALTVFVNSANPVQSISGEQLGAVFTISSSPEQVTWGAVGASGEWASKPLHVIARTEESGTQLFLSQFVFRQAAMRPATSSHPSNAEVLQAISADPLGIAICGYRSSGRAVKPLPLALGGSIIACDDLSVLSGRYPLMRPLTLVVDLGQTDDQAKASQEFVRYALCQAGQTQAILVGFFPVDLPLLRAGLEHLSPQVAR